MAKMKFDDLDALDEVANDAALQASPKKEEKKLKDMMVRGVNVEHYKILKRAGFTFGGYAKLAVLEKMQRDGLI